jgi:hypothetical protein
MSQRRFAGWVVLAWLLAASVPRDACGQQWSVDLSAGRIVYDPVSRDVGTSNLLATIRYEVGRLVWISGTAAAPLRAPDPSWAIVGGGGRMMSAGATARRAAGGVDLSAEAFVFRDRVARRGGSGGSVDALPFARINAGGGYVEVRGGWRGYRLSYEGAIENRGVLEAGARVGYGSPLHVVADARVVRAGDGTYSFVGASLVYGGAPVQLWGHTGTWLSDALTERVTWGGGIAVALGVRAALWAGVRQDTTDPLYWNAPRRTWSVGVTRRLGQRRPPVLASHPSQAGSVVIRVPVRDAPGQTLAIAGDFSNWRPMPMLRLGRDWVIRLQLAAGVYRYAFRSGTGEWFVPASVAGRRDDGMGGHVAVLVVT